jgi:hypothetical protein
MLGSWILFFSFNQSITHSSFTEMPGWMLVVFFLFGYVASSYHIPSLFYEQLIAVPDMSHKVLTFLQLSSQYHRHISHQTHPTSILPTSILPTSILPTSNHPHPTNTLILTQLLLASAAVGLTLGYIALIFVPLSRMAQRECSRYSTKGLAGHTSQPGGRVFSLEPEDDEGDEDEDVHAGKWNHVFTRRRGSF